MACVRGCFDGCIWCVMIRHKTSELFYCSQGCSCQLLLQSKPCRQLAVAHMAWRPLFAVLVCLAVARAAINQDVLIYGYTGSVE